MLRYHVSLEFEFEVAVMVRISKQRTNELIVFLHGFGSSMEHFIKAFSNKSLNDVDLIALDLIGFGESSKNKEFSYSMTDQAILVIKVLKELNIDTFHLCAHSMGSLVAQELVERFPERVLTFMNLEGNLTIEDCFMTGLVFKSSFNEFQRKGKKELEEQIGLRVPSDPSLLSYLKTFKQAGTLALYRSAEDTIRISKDPQLIKRFISLPKKCYFYGENNRGKFPAEKILSEAGVQVYYIEKAGHSMAEENPEQLYAYIRDFISINQ